MKSDTVMRASATLRTRLPRWLACASVAGLLASGACAQTSDLKLKLSCSHTQGQNDARVILADTGEIRIADGKLLEFRWESSLHRRTHGFDCSIDQSDNLELQALESGWRVSLVDGKAARNARGYDSEHGLFCLINLIRTGDSLLIEPSCPALCGSRQDFSSLKVDLKTGQCDYIHPPE